ncbi:MAG: hypothetical protein P8P74_00130 [Crocinitomicaceae bacterium]|nr:hypothetical protein [Crocinitomicaceae bacterium]
MSIKSRALFAQWFFLFLIVSYEHSTNFNLSLQDSSGFNSNFGDIVIIGVILLLISLVISLPFLLLTSFIVRYLDKSRKSVLFTNLIMLIFAVIMFFIISNMTASYYEGLIYVGSYFFAFALIINFHIVMRNEEEIPRD